jgi:ATP-binding cassette, subfamily B, multidrug efflux pump
MKKLSSINKYFIKYRWRFLSGIFFVAISNLFAVIPPTVIRTVIDSVQEDIKNYRLFANTALRGEMQSSIFNMVLWYGLLLLILALLRGVFMYFMRQTIIVMSRYIEYDQKNEIYNHYQELDTHFFKTHSTGDLMNRLAEDVSRVRMYTGPAIMYAVNLIVLTFMCTWGMLRVNPLLTVCVIVPLPILGFAIYLVNKMIYKKSERIQSQLSDLTTTAQESFSGIRVIKSFVQENNILKHFYATSAGYKDSNINLSLTEAVYFPSMNLFIGLSMLSTILVGGYFTIIGKATAGNIAEFVIYINLLMFPMFIIGWVASTIQRAAASQKRIDEFLSTKSIIQNVEHPITSEIKGNIHLSNINFKYQHTGIQALSNLSIDIKPSEKLIILGETGSGKSTIAQLLLRMYDPQSGEISIDGVSLKDYDLQHLRRNISYTPQEAFLFSDTVFNNIKFGKEDATEAEVYEASKLADLDKDIKNLTNGYQTIIGERGVMLSGGQKQRMVLARALLKNSPILLLDECLSAVDTRTEKTILHNLKYYLENKTVIVITHRIFTGWHFDKIIVLEDGSIVEQGMHIELMQRDGRYAKLFKHQTEDSTN